MSSSYQGGVPKDDRDMTTGIISGTGEVLVHGVTIAPGKPTIIGRIGNKRVFSLPGHPASAYVVLYRYRPPAYQPYARRKEASDPDHKGHPW